MVGRRKGVTSLTPLELQIMQILWRTGSCTVQQVQQGLAAENELAYNTVQTMLNVLTRKGRVGRMLDGRAYVYSAVDSKESVVGQAVRDFVQRVFGGSSEDLVMSLIKNRQVDLKQIADLGQRYLADEEDERHE